MGINYRFPVAVYADSMKTEKDRAGQPSYSAPTYSTLDAYVAGYLALKGHPPNLVDQGGKIAFVFQQTDDLRLSLNEFNAGAMVKASAFVFEIKSLKSQIHSTRMNKGTVHGYARPYR